MNHFVTEQLCKYNKLSDNAEHIFHGYLLFTSTTKSCDTVVVVLFCSDRKMVCTFRNITVIVIMIDSEKQH